jgi:hypothetical protein
MSTSLQRAWATDIVEAIPSVVFLALWRSDMDMQLAGWIGAVLAAVQLIGFRYYRVQYNPIMLGINIHLLVITPLIMAAFAAGAREFSDMLVAHSYRGVLITVLLVGCGLTLFSPRGFIGIDNLSRTDCWKNSGILLAASAVAIAWAFNYTGGTLLAVAAPMIGLFGLRRFLVARTLDGSNQIGGIVALGAASSLPGGTDADGV